MDLRQQADDLEEVVRSTLSEELQVDLPPRPISPIQVVRVGAFEKSSFVSRFALLAVVLHSPHTVGGRMAGVLCGVRILRSASSAWDPLTTRRPFRVHRPIAIGAWYGRVLVRLFVAFVLDIRIHCTPPRSWDAYCFGTAGTRGTDRSQPDMKGTAQSSPR